METKLFGTSEYDIAEAGKMIAEGKLVAFPTETVYGLGANALNEEAVRNIYLAKGRPSDNPLIVHIAEKEDIFGVNGFIYSQCGYYDMIKNQCHDRCGISIRAIK